MSEMNMPIVPESELRDLDVVTKQGYLMDLHKRAEQAERSLKEIAENNVSLGERLRVATKRAEQAERALAEQAPLPPHGA